MIIYDCISYFTEYDNNVLTEGYEGFLIDERKDKCYVIYKELRGEKNSLYLLI